MQIICEREKLPHKHVVCLSMSKVWGKIRSTGLDRIVFVYMRSLISISLHDN